MLVANIYEIWRNVCRGWQWIRMAKNSMPLLFVKEFLMLTSREYFPEPELKAFLIRKTFFKNFNKKIGLNFYFEFCIFDIGFKISNFDPQKSLFSKFEAKMFEQLLKKILKWEIINCYILVLLWINHFDFFNFMKEIMLKKYLFLIKQNPFSMS